MKTNTKTEKPFSSPESMKTVWCVGHLWWKRWDGGRGGFQVWNVKKWSNDDDSDDDGRYEQACVGIIQIYAPQQRRKDRKLL